MSAPGYVGDHEVIADHHLGPLAVEVANLQRPPACHRFGREDLRVQSDPVTETEPLDITPQIGLHLRAAGCVRVARRHREIGKAIGAFAVLGPQPGISASHTPHPTDIRSSVEHHDLVTCPAQHPRTGQPCDTRPHYRDPHPDRLSDQNSEEMSNHGEFGTWYAEGTQ
jgi:hypothetical protein